MSDQIWDILDAQEQPDQHNSSSSFPNFFYWECGICLMFFLQFLFNVGGSSRPMSWLIFLLYAPLLEQCYRNTLSIPEWKKSWKIIHIAVLLFLVSGLLGLGISIVLYRYLVWSSAILFLFLHPILYPAKHSHIARVIHTTFWWSLALTLCYLVGYTLFNFDVLHWVFAALQLLLASILAVGLTLVAREQRLLVLVYWLGLLLNAYLTLLATNWLAFPITGWFSNMYIYLLFPIYLLIIGRQKPNFIYGNNERNTMYTWMVVSLVLIFLSLWLLLMGGQGKSLLQLGIVSLMLYLFVQPYMEAGPQQKQRFATLWVYNIANAFSLVSFYSFFYTGFVWGYFPMEVSFATLGLSLILMGIQSINNVANRVFYAVYIPRLLLTLSTIALQILFLSVKGG